MIQTGPGCVQAGVNKHEAYSGTGWHAAFHRGALLSPVEAAALDTAAQTRLLGLVAMARDRQAFALLFKHFAPRLKAFHLGAGLADAAAEELAQETMLLLWRKAALNLPQGLVLPSVLAGCDIGPWRWFGPGLRRSLVRLPWAPDAKVMLVRMAPNAAGARHGHTAHELTLILHGGYDDGGQYGPGDLGEGDEAPHQPRADAEEADAGGCICLMALEGGWRLTGWLGWLPQRTQRWAWAVERAYPAGAVSCRGAGFAAYERKS